ncbi:MAG: hypothetical protein Q9166_001959 [cf. Caloplaca sp. 2 TL-2023]
MVSTARSRGHASSSRPSNTTARQSSRPTDLPPYQPLIHPLDPTAQHALHNLPTTHFLNDLKRRLQTAANHLTEITGDLNDQYQNRKAEFDKHRARKAARAKEFESSQPTEEDDQGEQRMEDAWNNVEEWTSKMEEGTRKVIDIQARVESTETALKELDANVRPARTATQSTLGASQYRSRTQRSRRQQHSDDDEEDDEDRADDAQEEAFTGPPALQLFKSKLSASSTIYDALSLKDRYASHNTYIGFRRIVHDARHPDEDIPLPDPSTWFPSSSDPTNSNLNAKSRSASAANQNQPSDDDNDEEITIALEKRSIRCPITLRPLVDPLTSTLCPHSYEKEAVLGMLDASNLRADGSVLPHRNAKVDKGLKCPECSVLLTKETLRVDPVLVRKIRRIEERERRQREGADEDDDDEEGEVEGVEEVTSSPVRSRGQVGMAVKRERMSQMREHEREVSMVPDSQVVDLGDGEEDDDDDED